MRTIFELLISLLCLLYHNGTVQLNNPHVEHEVLILNWFYNQQLSNGLLTSTESGNLISLYDNSLAALVFMLNEDYARAEKIFDFFDDRILSELKNGTGGFSQFRNIDGEPSYHRWVGDNAWLLLALNNYKYITGTYKYDYLILELSNWLIYLQDHDGGIFAGYDEAGNLMRNKVTEGILDVFSAISGYGSFHQNILRFLSQNCWDKLDNNMITNQSWSNYNYALDLHSWSYLLFEDYDPSSLTKAERYVTTQISSVNGESIIGYCFDIDRDVVWLEGTSHMALAFNNADAVDKSQKLLAGIERNLIMSQIHPNSGGFPYVSNTGTAFGTEKLWDGAEDKISISTNAWYLFAKWNFNPFGISRNKNIPVSDKFWIK